MVFFYILLVMGILYLVFAFVPPPGGIAHFFRIPAIFVFFPEKNRERYARVAVGALMIVPKPSADRCVRPRASAKRPRAARSQAFETLHAVMVGAWAR